MCVLAVRKAWEALCGPCYSENALLPSLTMHAAARHLRVVFSVSASLSVKHTIIDRTFTICSLENVGYPIALHSSAELYGQRERERVYNALASQ